MYLVKKLSLDNDKPAKSKSEVVEVWEKHFAQLLIVHVRDYLRKDGFLRPNAELRLKDFNKYLRDKLNLKKKRPAKSKAEIAAVWDQYFEQIQALE